MNQETNNLFGKRTIRNVIEIDDESDEEFSLRDVDPTKAVGSILEAGTSEEEDDDGIFAGDGDTDSVQVSILIPVDDFVKPCTSSRPSFFQNAINSILDTIPQGDRMHTPDLNNLTGFLDSIEDDDIINESDPAIEAAVNSIPQF